MADEGLLLSWRGAAFRREERSDVAGRGNPDAAIAKGISALSRHCEERATWQSRCGACMGIGAGLTAVAGLPRFARND